MWKEEKSARLPAVKENAVSLTMRAVSAKTKWVFKKEYIRPNVTPVDLHTNRLLQSWCDEIEACDIIKEKSSGKSLEGIEVCIDFSILTWNEINYCTSLCNKYSCCFYDDVSECDALDCSQFKYCIQMIDYDSNPSDNGPIGGEDGLQPGPLPKQVNIACTSDVNLNECYYLCSSYLCCFYDTYDPMSCHATEICAKYSSCFILIDADAPSESFAMNTSAYYNIEIYYPAEGGLYPADEICSIDNLSMNHGLQQCEALCSKHMCCFGGINACPYRNDCPIYQACGILTDTSLLLKGPEGPLIFNFMSICSLNSLKTIGGKNACTRICKPVRSHHFLQGVHNSFNVNLINHLMLYLVSMSIFPVVWLLHHRYMWILGLLWHNCTLW